MRDMRAVLDQLRRDLAYFDEEAPTKDELMPLVQHELTSMAAQLMISRDLSSMARKGLVKAAALVLLLAADL